MPIYFLDSNLIRDTGSCDGATVNTSSQIFLSRGVADMDSEPAISTPPTSTTTVASIFESDSAHIMTLGDAAAQTVSSQRSSYEESSSAYVNMPGEEEIHATPVSNTTMLRPEDTNKEVPSPRFTRTPDDLSDCGDDLSLDSHPPTPLSGKGKGKGIARGRNLERGFRSPNPLERAESRKRRNEPAIEIDARSIGKRAISRSSTFFENPYDPEAVLDDCLLEPCPNIPICENVSEVLNTPTRSTTAVNTPLRRIKTSSSFGSFQSLANTLSRTDSDSTSRTDYPTLFPGATLHPERAFRAYTNIDHLEHLLANQSLSEYTEPNSSIIPPPTVAATPESLGSHLPVEILQQIYLYLSPTDFNSARHACRSWFIHSLNQSLLETFLRRMGFSDAIRNTTSTKQVGDSKLSPNYEWLLSNRISRECALGPNWLGHGLAKNSSSEATSTAAFTLASTIDFTDVAVHYPGANSAGTLLTISACGRFLMAASGCLVYVYELNRSERCGATPNMTKSGALRPVTSIICPSRVLACSMDTSSHRYAVAILLDGRMAVVCEITNLTSNPSSPKSIKRKKDLDEHHAQDHILNETASEGSQGVGLDRAAHKHSPEPKNWCPSQDSSFVFPGFANPNPPFPSVNQLAWQDLFKDEPPEQVRVTDTGLRHSCLPQVRILGSGDIHSGCENPRSLPMPIEEGPRSLYRNLCSEDDPPRSVAICPQRRCVAFGCSSGIELHWVDALTGQNLNRWFPLTAPSDYLFFLPPRKSVDSAKKLRLISSAARPNERPAIAERQNGGRNRDSPYWEELSHELGRSSYNGRFDSRRGGLPGLIGEISRRHTSGRVDASDHYRAVPLSDGYHILFTDPATGLLCLGSDAPVGGPTKLLRKIWFQGPEEIGTPTAYASGSDITSGVRVVAAYGIGDQHSVWMFSVPSDVFSISQYEPCIPSVYGTNIAQPNTNRTNRHKQNTDWMAWSSDENLHEWINHAQDPVPGVLPRGIWPVKIRGQFIGTCTGIADLTIHSGSQMSIWAFGKDGLARVWKIDNGTGERVRKYCVARDGTVKETIDSDVGVPEPGLAMPPLRQDSFDGTASLILPTLGTIETQIRPTKHRRVAPTYQRPPAPEFDADGDVIMNDAGEVHHSRRYKIVEAANKDLATHGEVYMKRMRVFNQNRKSASCWRMEKLTDITMLDLEIQGL